MAGHSWYKSPAAQVLQSLTDDSLFCRIRVVVAQERENAADLVEYLLELDRRGIHIDLGFPSLFTYCTQELGYSEQAAYLRIRAVRVALDMPEIIAHLRDGRLSLENIARVAPYLNNPQTAAGILARALGATKREVLALVAELNPIPIERDVIIPVAPTMLPTDTTATEPNLPPQPLSGESTVALVPPLRHRIHFTADDELVRLLDRLRGLLRHKHPSGRLEAIIKDAAKALIDKLEPTHRRPGRPRSAGPIRSRIVSRAVKREVWERDQGRCTYESEGRRCGNRDWLEYDHIRPWALGGTSDDPANIRLLCRAHNQRLARKRFGPRRRAESNPA